MNGLCYVIFASFIIALTRAWALIRGDVAGRPASRATVGRTTVQARDPDADADHGMRVRVQPAHHPIEIAEGNGDAPSVARPC